MLAALLVLAWTSVAAAQTMPELATPGASDAERFLAYRDYVYSLIPALAEEREPVMLGVRILYVRYAMASYQLGYETYWQFRTRLDIADLPRYSAQPVLERQFVGVLELLRGNRLDLRTAADILTAIYRDWEDRISGVDKR